MGWSSFPMHEPVKNWFKNLWDEGGKYEVIDCALVQRQTIYGALKIKATGEIFCAVYLVRWSRDHYNFSYKSMTEHSGPCVCDCPERIFKLLTPLEEIEDNRFAIDWRKRVQSLLNKRKLVKSIKKEIIKTKELIGFGKFLQLQYFKKEGRKYYAGDIEDGKFRFVTRVGGFNPVNYEYELITL